jgi:hypothetical protein
VVGRLRRRAGGGPIPALGALHGSALTLRA